MITAAARTRADRQSAKPTLIWGAEDNRRFDWERRMELAMRTKRDYNTDARKNNTADNPYAAYIFRR